MLQSLIDTLSIQTVSYNQYRMFAYIIRVAKSIPNTIVTVKDENIYIKRGISDTYPCVVAHMDTVHDIESDLTPVVLEGKIFGINKNEMTPIGIGGDDKVGVYIALECLRTYDNIKVAFFHDEEVGCLGSYDADMSFFDDCRFVLQCDRRGNSDFVTNASGTELSSKKFCKAVRPILENYGYKFATGMMTDVMALKQNGLPVSCANISCGYYNPHTENEYVVIDDVFNTLYLVMEIIDKLQRQYRHQCTYSYNDYSSNYYYPRYGKSAAPLHPTTSQTRIHYEVPRDDWFGYSDDFAIQKAQQKLDDQKNHCADCWSPLNQPTASGFCDPCDRWYSREGIRTQY